MEINEHFEEHLAEHLTILLIFKILRQLTKTVTVKNCHYVKLIKIN